MKSERIFLFRDVIICVYFFRMCCSFVFNYCVDFCCKFVILVIGDFLWRWGIYEVFKCFNCFLKYVNKVIVVMKDEIERSVKVIIVIVKNFEIILKEDLIVILIRIVLDNVDNVEVSFVFVI